MQKMLFSIVMLCIINTVFAQKNDVSNFAQTITEKDLKKHLYYIAGPECEGRGTGTPGIAKAAAYIEKEFKSYGLKPGNGKSYQMEYTLYEDSIASSSITISGKTFEHGKDFTATNRNNIAQTITETQIVYVGYGIETQKYSDYNNIDVKGKIVLIQDGEPMTADSVYTISGTKTKTEWSSPGIDKKAEIAKQKGAVALFIIVTKFQASNNNARRPSIFPVFRMNNNVVNRYYISDAMAKLLLPQSVATGTVLTTGASIAYNKIRKEKIATNVVGLLPGTDKKDEYIVITAHMDHLGKRDTVIYYGADDDGSGTCAVMEMAQAFAEAKKNGKGPRRSILFMTVSGEEMGLWGSAYYAKYPIFDLAKTSVNLNIDMIGRVGSDYIKDAPDSLNYVYVIGDDKLSTDLRPISEEANKMTQLKLDYRYNDPNDKNRFYYRSDHYNFAEKGVPIIFYFDGVHKDYHRPTDTPDKINYDLYEKRSRLVFYTGWLMANRDDMLKRDIPLK